MSGSAAPGWDADVAVEELYAAHYRRLVRLSVLLVRDVETATTAVRAANSGHLVLATMHAPIAAAAVQAMLNLGVHAHHLASCLLGVIAQRLVRTLNTDTRVSYDASAMSHVFNEVKRYLEPGQGEVIYGPGPAAASPGCVPR